jgi:hypothetical protein
MRDLVSVDVGSLLTIQLNGIGTHVWEIDLRKQSKEIGGTDFTQILSPPPLPQNMYIPSRLFVSGVLWLTYNIFSIMALRRQ